MDERDDSTDNPSLCQHCEISAAEEPHVCPYAYDMSNGQEDDLCNCCDNCTAGCAYDI